MPSKITNPKTPEWFTNLEKGFIDQKISHNESLVIYKIYEITGRIIWIYNERIKDPSFFQLLALTTKDLENYHFVSESDSF